MTDDNFHSIDRLVEFGLGVAVAQQMVNSMNTAIQQSSMPGAAGPGMAGAARSFWVMLDEGQAGPFDEAELSRLIASNRLRKDSHVWRPGMPAWRTVESTPEVLRLVALVPPPFTQGK